MDQSRRNYNRGGGRPHAGETYGRRSGGSGTHAGETYGRRSSGSGTYVGETYGRRSGGSGTYAGETYGRRSSGSGTYARGAYGRETDGRTGYVYGNVAYQPDVRRMPEEAPRRRAEPAVRKNRDRARHMSAGYVLFLAAAMCVCALILVNYVQLQARLTNVTRSVADKESELNSLRNANDEAYNRIVRSVNLEDVKRVAICELGMTYAQEGQVIFYTKEESDYMRQVSGD